MTIAAAAMRGAGLFVGVAMAAVIAGDAPAQPMAERTVAITAHPIPSFRIGRPDVADFGVLTFIGGLELQGDTRRVGGLSGLVLRDGGSRITAVTDDGLLLVATIRRDDSGRPVAFDDARMKGLVSGEKRDRNGAGYFDSEGFDISADGSTGWVSVEGITRVLKGPVEPDGFLGPLLDVPLPTDARKVRWSKGFETLALAPADSPFPGRAIIIAERPPRSRDDGKRPAWVLAADGGGEPLRFLVSDDGFDITDAAFGPSGDLYLLERLYTPGVGVKARIRRISLADIAEGATVDGPVVLDADLATQIDNMEGIDIWTRADGTAVVSLISDDNRSFMQRTVYLEFALREDD